MMNFKIKRIFFFRLYFTSESHIHSLLTVLRYGGLLDSSKDEQWRRALEYISEVSELNYMTQIVIMLYEDETKDVLSEERFHVELHFSPGVFFDLSRKHLCPASNDRCEIHKWLHINRSSSVFCDNAIIDGDGSVLQVQCVVSRRIHHRVRASDLKVNRKDLRPQSTGIRHPLKDLRLTLLSTERPRIRSTIRMPH